MEMPNARYLPASRVKAGSLRLGRLSVWSSDGRELGKLIGFVVEAGEHCIRSLVVEASDRQLEVPMGPVQFDATSRSLRMLPGSQPVAPVPFSADRLPVIDDQDLWVPLFTTAA
jgi:hypothetical protein